MDIHVEAPNHPNFTQLEDHYRTTLSEKYRPFEFIKKIEVKVNKEKEGHIVKLMAALEKDPKAFVQATHESEDKAFKEAMLKLDHIIRKYKTKHYHGY